MDYAAVHAAAGRLQGVVHHTPVMTSRTLNAQCGNTVFLKCENFQRSGAFKIRGAYNALSQLDDAARARGVITYSSGNHAQATALAGGLLGTPVVVVMPTNAPAPKVAATKGYGAEVVLYDPAKEEREDVAEAIRLERKMTLVPPFNHEHVIAGQGTAALELCGSECELDAVLTPCGGGGLLSGTSIAVKHLLPQAKVYGVEPEAANSANLSFRSGSVVPVEHPVTMADGLKPKSVSELTLACIRQNVDDMFTVTEEEIRSTLFFLWSRMKLLVEPSGAVGLAAVYHRKIPQQGKRIGVVLSGGNADIGAVADWFRADQA